MLGGPEFLYANITMRAPRRFSAWKTMLAKVFSLSSESTIDGLPSHQLYFICGGPARELSLFEVQKVELWQLLRKREVTIAFATTCCGSSNGIRK